MKYTNEDINLENGIQKEWIITNGIGGFASSTIIGANTRKYHGLLIAPLTPPARRYLILSKVDESIEIGGKQYNLYTNIGKNYITKGYEYQTSFEKEELPIFTYQIGDVEITKTICMKYGENTVGILYKIRNGKQPSKLTLAPLMNFRDFHSMSTNHEFAVRQENKNTKVKVIIDNMIQNPVYMKVSEGTYIPHQNDIFRHMFYVEEQKRGFYPEENHVVVGRFEIDLKPNEEKEISFVCSLEENIDELDVNKVILSEKKRIEKILKNAEIELDNKTNFDENLNTEQAKKSQVIKDLVIASDTFIAYRPSFRLHTIIAGYPWFLDWGRDSLISFEGLLLKTKRYDLAKEVLKTMMRDIKYGLVPNGYSGFDNRPLYNSVDASLLFFEQVKKYLEYTNDNDFVMEDIYPKMENIIENYAKGVDLDNNNIYMDTDGLIVSGTENTQNTWMDAKYAGIAVTPRNGKPVEINAMWYNALKIMNELALKNKEEDKAKKYEKMAIKCKKSFESKFYNKRRKCLYDVLGDSKIRPNQLFVLSLTYPVLDPKSEEAKNMFETVTKKLLNNYGLKSLAKGEENYVEIYEGDGARRDFSYHQGITWTWLLGPYYNALKQLASCSRTKEDREMYKNRLKEFVENVTKTFSKEINERGCIGSIAEIYDSKRPYSPKGAFAQAWSIAEVFRIIVQA
mgnify:CR=1 FL=1